MAQNDRAIDNRTDRNPARNLTHEDRVRGGRNSAAQQTRDAHGQFAGRRSGEAARTGEMPRGEMNEQQRHGA